MTAQVNFIPEGPYSIHDVETLVIAFESVVKAREVMHRKEAADFLGINIRTLDRLATAGSIPYHKIKGLEGTRLYLRSELVAHIKKS